MLTDSMRRSDRQITDRREMDEILENGRLGHLITAEHD
jgi:nitroimidazol reductase NimA-like FMN-containing flavoprotein (pyridoxamine 5'-phosphate oxidase superfamily)